MKKITLFLFIMFIQACSIFRPPVIQDRISPEIWPWSDSKVGTFAISPDYSMTFIKLSENAMFCAQPPADAASQISTAIEALAKVTIPQGPEVNAQAKASIANSIKQLFRRSQGIQLYRDGQFALCNAYLNKVIDEKEYVAELSKLRDTAADLVKEEVKNWKDYAYDTTAPPLTPPKPPEPSANRPQESNANKLPVDTPK